MSSKNLAHSNLTPSTNKIAPKKHPTVSCVLEIGTPATDAMHKIARVIDKIESIATAN